MSETLIISPSQIMFQDIIDPNFSCRKLPGEKDKDYDKFKELKEDIAENGLQNLFTVRCIGEKEGKLMYVPLDGNRRAYAIVMLYNEGDQRFLLRYPDGISVQVTEASDTDALARQIAGNHHVLKQKPASLAKSLYRLLLSTDWTLEMLATKVGMSRGYIEQLLKINALPDATKDLINEGTITSTNAIHLTRVPEAIFNEDIVEQSKIKTGAEFSAYVDELVKEYKKALREGKDPAAIDGTIVFSPQPRLRMKEELEGMYVVAVDRANSEPCDFNRGYAEALRYCFRMDNQTLELDRAAFDVDQKQKAEDKERRKQERSVKKTANLLESLKKDPELAAKIKQSLS